MTERNWDSNNNPIESSVTLPTTLLLKSLVGQKIGRYEVRALEGAGGMGEVYRAHDPLLRRDVAIKRIAQKLHGDATYREQFLKEARRLADLNCENIASLYDIVEENGDSLLVMEYVRGSTLRDRLRKPLNTKEFYSLATQCLNAVQAFHGCGIVHRDIKPGNILLTSDFKVKICDFGLAQRPSDFSTGGIRHDDVVGTPGYIAPEVLRTGRAASSADIYSLGVVFYEALRGERPPRPSDVETKNERQTPINVRLKIAPTQRLLTAMIDPDPAKRPTAVAAKAQVESLARPRSPRVLQMAAAVVAAVALAWLLPQSEVAPFGEGVQVLLADIVNNTPAPVFDRTLKQALAITLEESPFLQIFSDAGVRATLSQMERSPDQLVTPALAPEICERAGIGALISGEINPLNDSYVINLNAMNCVSGDVISRE